MDIHTCRSIRQHSEGHGVCGCNHKPYTHLAPGKHASCRIVSCGLFHIAVNRHQRWNYRRTYSNSGRLGRIARNERAIDDCRDCRRVVLRRQPLVHLRHHHYRHKHTGMQVERQVSGERLSCFPRSLFSTLPLRFHGQRDNLRL